MRLLSIELGCGKTAVRTSSWGFHPCRLHPLAWVLHWSLCPAVGNIVLGLCLADDDPALTSWLNLKSALWLDFIGNHQLDWWLNFVTVTKPALLVLVRYCGTAHLINEVTALLSSSAPLLQSPVTLTVDSKEFGSITTNTNGSINEKCILALRLLDILLIYSDSAVYGSIGHVLLQRVCLQNALEYCYCFKMPLFQILPPNSILFLLLAVICRDYKHFQCIRLYEKCCDVFKYNTLSPQIK